MGVSDGGSPSHHGLTYTKMIYFGMIWGTTILGHLHMCWIAGDSH